MPQAATQESYSNIILLPSAKESTATIKRRVRPSDRRREVTEKEREGRKSSHSFRSAEEVNLMLSDFLECGEWRDALLFVTGLNTRFRSIDLSILRWEDIIDEEYRVRPYWWFTEQKTGKPVHIVSNEALTRMIYLYMRKVGAPKELASFVFAPAGNRRSYFQRWKDRCDSYEDAMLDIVRGNEKFASRIQLYRERGIEPVLEDYSRQQVHVVFEDGSTIDWPYIRQGKLWIREQEHSDIPVGLSPESISEIIKKRAEKLGLYDVEEHRIAAHTTRKTFATAVKGLLSGRSIPRDLYDNTVPTDIVAKVMNHSSATTTDHYIEDGLLVERLYQFVNLGIEAIEEFEKKEGFTSDTENS